MKPSQRGLGNKSDDAKEEWVYGQKMFKEAGRNMDGSYTEAVE